MMGGLMMTCRSEKKPTRAQLRALARIKAETNGDWFTAYGMGIQERVLLALLNLGHIERDITTGLGRMVYYYRLVPGSDGAAHG